MRTLLLIILSISLFTGCTGSFGPIKGQESVRKNIVHIGWDGNFYKIPDQKQNSNGELIDQAIDSKAGFKRLEFCQPRHTQINHNKKKCLDSEQLKKEKDAFKVIIDGIKKFSRTHENGYKKVMIFVHGGLNSRHGSLERAIISAKIIEEQGIYPIFINWRSGIFSTLKDHYFRIRDGEISDTAVYTSPAYLIGDLAMTIGNTPIAWWKEGIHSLNSSFVKDYSHIIKDALAIKRIPVAFTGDGKQTTRPLRGLQWILTSPFKLITTLIVFTLGTPAWDNMKRRTQTMFIRPKDLNHAPVEIKAMNESYDHGYGGAMNFIRYLKKNIDNKKIKITLIGHSMGGIIINNILRADPKLPIENIVYMASADNLQSYIDVTIPYVTKYHGENDVNVYSLHLHPENEDHEVRAYGLVPSGSLLVWIDSIFESPEYALQRTAGRWQNMRRVIALIPKRIKTQFHFKIFGRNYSEDIWPQEHGDFANCKFEYWNKSYWQNENARPDPEIKKQCKNAREKLDTDNANDS